MIYGNNDIPDASNGMFALYSSDPNTGLPSVLEASTNGTLLNTAQTYDNIAFTSTPVISAGTYWMMGLYETTANPRMDLSNGSSEVAYWSQAYGSFNATAPTVNTYYGQNFNYWVNGQVVPEPASLLALAPAALGLLFKRRKA